MFMLVSLLDPNPDNPKHRTHAYKRFDLYKYSNPIGQDDMSLGLYSEPEYMVCWSVSAPYNHVASTLRWKSKALGDATSEDIASVILTYV